MPFIQTTINYADNRLVPIPEIPSSDVKLDQPVAGYALYFIC